MKKHLLRALFILSFLGLIFLVSACSVEISQTQLVPTRTAAPPTDTPAPTLTPTDTPTQPPTLTPTATQPGDPTATASPTPTPTVPFLFPTVGTDLQNFSGQSATGLQGRMIFLATLADGTQAVLSFEPGTGTLSALFVTEPNTKAWILSASVASDASGILLSYAPPPPPGKPSYGYTDQYVLRPDGQLDPVLLRTEDVEAMFGSFFTPAMDYVYYSYFFADNTAPSGFRYHIYRAPYKAGSGAAIGASAGVGTPELVVENAYWERMSADGTKMAYVTFGDQDYDEMFVSNADGSNPVRVLDPAQFPTIDAPFFSPDNQYLYFSAVSDTGTPTPLAWWEKLMGVHIASAHTVPSDFWRVSLVDGSAQQITDLKAQGMFGDFSPDGTQIAFITSSGLYVMQPDGSGLVQLLEASTLYGNIEWVP
ncbi:MAG: PD40 domain-containing protein [Anaerolineales bacterium]|nr:PD40 domain-containing protein [Anaerolineales bacterium]